MRAPEGHHIAVAVGPRRYRRKRKRYWARHHRSGPLEAAQLQGGGLSGASEKKLVAAPTDGRREEEFAPPTETRPGHAGRKEPHFQFGASHVKEDVPSTEKGGERKRR